MIALVETIPILITLALLASTWITMHPGTPRSARPAWHDTLDKAVLWLLVSGFVVYVGLTVTLDVPGTWITPVATGAIVLATAALAATRRHKARTGRAESNDNAA